MPRAKPAEPRPTLWGETQPPEHADSAGGLGDAMASASRRRAARDVAGQRRPGRVVVSSKRPRACRPGARLRVEGVEVRQRTCGRYQDSKRCTTAAKSAACL